MNESKQEPEVPSKETSGKEVRKSSILCSNLHRLVFAFKQSLHRKLRRTSFGLSNPESCAILFNASTFPNLTERDRIFSLSWKDLAGKVSKVKRQVNEATMALIN